ncbi:transcription factor IBH1-like 1 [Phoenix dactylifera]|uniref:Transcription factor IBH1-like 1 n=1 Tax=Phoenix dactylifera TaxID=42345 RepID=A0A8B7CV12_PHODC|nr:transcription factor IBH1-like 1 [Phoenix dactylifera]XP_038977726.1 transcription factor IBH1-like 1 [Phoenix dactylifera]
MQASETFMRAFLKRMLLGLQVAGVSSESMTIQERESAIKLSADAALAGARGSTNWTRALIANLSKQARSKALLRSILGKDYERLTKPCHHTWKIPRSRKILRRSVRVCSRRRNALRAPATSVLARVLVKKRTQVLKRLIPGGESLDGFYLLDETLDYVVSLRVQVDLMQRLLKAVEASNLRSPNVLQAREASSFRK